MFSIFRKKVNHYIAGDKVFATFEEAQMYANDYLLRHRELIEVRSTNKAVTHSYPCR